MTRRVDKVSSTGFTDVTLEGTTTSRLSGFFCSVRVQSQTKVRDHMHKEQEPDLRAL